ncbi:HlyD family type I secretion periplasmic adaptor subunit [Sulfurimonas sp. SAG-AH-194-C20]|nr:HlyD family type I secretion periplasmic adaptor subunit [Sulfurimonas sp. SAG-AH-194-C20]MDF1879424.1 HlyD family type I secretion periplasmic adaptor subunit [Sulfurimonas sp. SAG-AH-194-C20]
MNSIVDFETHWNHRIVTWPIMLFSAVFIVWASYSEIDESVVGTGTVVPSSETKIIQHLEGGIIEEIFVQEGDSVIKGEALFRLSQAFFLSDQKEKQIELLALYASEIRLNAEIQEKSIVHFDKEFGKSIPLIVKNEKSKFKANLQAFNEELELLTDTINKKSLEIKQMTNKLYNLETELKIARENVSIQENLVRQGASSRQMYLTALATKQSFITEKQSLKNSVPIVKEELKESKQKFQNYKSKEHVKQLKELGEVRLSISKLSERSKANSDREVRKTIKSPVNGTIKEIYFHTIGGIVKPGDPVVEITPIGDSLLILGQIKTSDRAKVWVGQKVSVSITAFEFSRYGSLEGTLVTISSDSFTNEKGVSFYEVKISTSKASFGENEIVLPGMSADINILTGKKTIMQYILKPLKDIKKNALREH